MKKSFLLLVLLVVTFGVYAPALRNEIVWDDTALILRDPFIRSWRLIPEGFQHFLFTDATASDFYRPIQRLTYTLEYAAYGVQPLGYHLTSIAIHAAAAMALFFFGLELLRSFAVAEPKRTWISLGAALVWAIHPAHSGAVAYISGRADPLAAAFGFAGLALALASARSSGGRQWALTLAATACCLLSALSKEAGLIFLALWIAIFLLRREWKHAARGGVASLFVLAIYLSLRMAAEHTPPMKIQEPAPLLVRPILVARAFAEYTYLIFAPINLHMERDVESHPTGFSNESLTHTAWRELETLAGILLLAGFVYWLLHERKRDRAVFICLVLTLIAYLPISGLVPLNASIAEHWLYLPSAFLFLAFGIVGARLLASLQERPAVWRTTAAAALLVWVSFLGARSFIRTFDWKDQRTFFETAINSGGDTPRMLINLAGVEMQEGKLDAAKAHLQRALEKEPDQPLAVLNLGAVAIRQEDYKTARELLNRAVQMEVVAAQAHELLVVLGDKETGTADVLRMRLATRTGPP
ncbi:MAG: tetratricopeptide repeat protein, partial [Chthoniobacterales bacterium]|nr:tetratricopeptide repeat protein [Chthoniobacterales bacterium]